MINISKIIGCYNCGKEQETYYTFTLEKINKHVKLCKGCLKGLTEGCIEMGIEERISFKIKNRKEGKQYN